MRKSILLAIGLIIITIPTAGAASSTDCSKGSTAKRLSCLQSKIADLTATIARLATKADLDEQAVKFGGEVEKVKGQIPKLDDVVMQWAGNPGSCITYREITSLKFGMSVLTPIKTGL